MQQSNAAALGTQCNDCCALFGFKQLLCEGIDWLSLIFHVVSIIIVFAEMFLNSERALLNDSKRQWKLMKSNEL